MIRAVYRNGIIEPLNGVPHEWQEGEELSIDQIDRFLGPDDPIPDLEERLAALHALGPMEFEPGEKEQIEKYWRELDDLGRQEMQRILDQRS